MSAGAASLTPVPIPDLIAQQTITVRELLRHRVLPESAPWSPALERDVDKLVQTALQTVVDTLCQGLKEHDDRRIQMSLQYGSLADLVFNFAPFDALEAGTYYDDFLAVRAVLERMLRDAKADRKKVDQLETWFSQATAGKAFVEKLLIADAFDDLDRGGKKRSELLRLLIDTDNARVAAEEKLAAAEERIRQLEAAIATSTCHI
jgi:hypothetical protein